MSDQEPTSSAGRQPDLREEDDTVSLLDLLGVLARRWRLIFFTSFFAGVGIVLFSLYTIRLPADSPYNPLPNVYRPKAEILLQDSSSSGISSALSGSDLGALAGLVGISGTGGGGASAARAERLLTQNWILDLLIEEFDLLTRFAEADSPKNAARGWIRGNLEAEHDSASSIMTVSFTDIDPVFATEILQKAVELLEARFKGLTRNEAQAKAEAYRAQIASLENELLQARNAMIAFQQRWGILDPEVQIGQMIAALVELNAQVYQLELERETLLEYNAADSPQVRRKQLEIDNLKELIKQLEEGGTTFSNQSIPRNQFGALAVQYADLQRDLTLKEGIYTRFQTELVAAEVEAQDISRVFQVIEPPEVPEIKDGPSRAMISVIVTVTAFFLSVFLAFVLEYFARARRDPAEAEKLEIIRDQFRPKRRRKHPEA